MWEDKVAAGAKPPRFRPGGAVAGRVEFDLRVYMK